MLIFHKNVTACLLHDWLTFLCIVIFPGRNVIMNMSPFQLSLTCGSYCHHWFRSVLHNANSGIQFISGRHHIYTDKTDDNRFYYLMDHSPTDTLTTNFFKLRQAITVTFMQLITLVLT